MRSVARELFAAAFRAGRRLLRYHLTGTAAELAYYGLLSAMPCVTAFVGIVGLIGSDPETTEAIVEIVRNGVSIEAGTAAREAAREVVERDGAAGAAVSAGVLTTLWAASLYVAAFRRAAYRVHDTDPGPTLRRRPLQMVLTFLGLVVLAVVALALVVTTRLVRGIGDALGDADAAVTVWSLSRWPLTLLLAALVTAGLYRLAPPHARPAGRRLTTGVVAAVLSWMIASIGFEVWVGRFADYDATYGALAGAIAFAVWLWISNLALLFGMALDLELQSAPRAHVGRDAVAGPTA